MPLPPGLNGYFAAQQAGNQNQAAQLQAIQGLIGLQHAIAEQQMNQQAMPYKLDMLKAQTAEHQAKVKQMEQEAAMSAQLGGLMGGNLQKLDPDQLDALGAHLAITKHPGAATVMNIADKRRKQIQDAQALQGMQSSPGVTPATPNDDEGNPMPSVPAQPGVFGPLMASKYPQIAAAAAAHQQTVNSGGGNTQQVMQHMDALTRLAETNSRTEQVQTALDNRQNNRAADRVDFRLQFPPGMGADHSPYTNVQSDGRGGMIGLNKKTLRMEAIPMAPGVTTSGYGQVTPSNVNLTGDAFLETLPAADRAIVKAVAEGRTAVTDLSTKGGHREAIIKAANQYAPGFDSVMTRSNATSLNKMIAQYDAVTSFEKNAVRNGDTLLQLADKVDATGVPALERWIRAGRQATGDVDVAKFNAQIQVYRTEAARILTNPNLSGVLTDSARKETEHFLSGNASAGQIREVVGLLKSDFGNRRRTLEQQIRDNRSRGFQMTSEPDAVPTPSARPPLSSFKR